MVETKVDNNPVSVQLNTNESVTVPTGELWEVNISHMPYTDVDLTVDGVRERVIFKAGNDTVKLANFKAVLKAGDMVHNDNYPNNGAVSVSGFDVLSGTHTKDNPVVTELITPDDSVTVPAGEVWDVQIIVDHYVRGYVNNDRLFYNEGIRDAECFDMTLVGGDTVEHDGRTTNAGIYISGYKVSY